jgi:hypothetical protein
MQTRAQQLVATLRVYVFSLEELSGIKVFAFRAERTDGRFFRSPGVYALEWFCSQPPAVPV